eukprot:4372280-Pleurochrysis_carterae.AAC.1
MAASRQTRPARALSPPPQASTPARNGWGRMPPQSPVACRSDTTPALPSLSHHTKNCSHHSALCTGQN